MAVHQLWSIRDKKLIATSSSLQVADDEAARMTNILGRPVLLVIDCVETREERIARRLGYARA